MIKKLVALFGTVVFFITAVVFTAKADVFNPTDGTVTVMASGGTVYSDYGAAANQVNGAETVGSVTVPPGKYLVQAKAWADQSVGSESFVQCNLMDLGINDRTRLGAGSGYSAALVATEVAIITVQDTIEFVCVSDAPVDIYNVVLTATTVSAVNYQ